MRARVLLSLALVALTVVGAWVPSVQAIGQPALGFSEIGGGRHDRLRILDQAGAVDGDMKFAGNDTLQVRIETDRLTTPPDPANNLLELRDYRDQAVGGVMSNFSYSRQPPVTYLNSTINWSNLAPDWYYVWMDVDETGGGTNRFRARQAIIVGAPQNPHFVRTYTDNTFTTESDVFAENSQVFVEVRGDAGGQDNGLDQIDFADNGLGRGFQNFQSMGQGVYRFGFMLNGGGIQQGWYYWLDVDLAQGGNPIYRAGKLFQVRDPQVNVSSSDSAPVVAYQGQRGVSTLAPALAVTSTMPWGDTSGPAAFNLDRLRITLLTANGGNPADVAAMSLFSDLNGNRKIDAGEPEIARTQGPVGPQTWVGTTATAAYLTPSAPLNLVVGFDIAPTAVVGHQLGARIETASAADIDIDGNVAFTGSAPFDSSLMTIAAATIVEADWNDQAPGNAAPGDADLVMGRLRLRTNAIGNFANFTGLFVNLTGNPPARSDIASARLVHDRNRNDNIDGADRTLADAPFPGAGQLHFTFPAVQLRRDPRENFLIAYNLSATAVPGDTVGAEITANTSIEVFDVGPVWVGNPPGLFPMQSTDTLITGAVMGVEGLNLVPGGCVRLVAAGSTNLPLLMIHFSIAGGQVAVTSLRVDRSGSANSDTDIAAVKAWNDTNGNRRFEPALDIMLGTGTFVGGTATIGLSPNVSVTPGAPRDLFISFDISSTATAGETAGVGMADETYIGTVPPLAADPNAFPINSGTYLVVGAPPSCLTISHVDLAASVPLLQIARNQTDVPMLLVNLSASGNLTTAKALRVDRRGTSTDVDVARARIWHDLNKNGKLDRQTDVPLGTATFVNGVATTSLGQGVTVAFGTTESLIVALDIAANAVAGHTVGVEMGNPPLDYLTVDPPPPATLIAYAGGPPQSTDLTIVDKPAPALSVHAADLATSVPNLQVFRNQTNVGMLALRLTATAPTNVTGIRVDGRGTAGPNIGQDVSGVSVWLDDGDEKFWPVTDTKQAAGSFVSGVVTLGFTANFGTGQTRTLFVAFDIASTATTGNQVGAELDDARYFGVDFGTTVVLDPASPLDFPIRSTQLTIAAGTPPPPKGTVNVLVKDKTSQAGIAGASVNVSSAGYGKTFVTDASGNASFADVPLGIYTVRVSHVDYDAATDQTATLNAAIRTANVTFELTKKTTTPPGPGGSNTLLILLIALFILGALVALLLMKRKKCPECSANWKMGQEQCWKCGHKPDAKKEGPKNDEKPPEAKKEGRAASLAKEESSQVEREEPAKSAGKRPEKKDDMVPPAPLD